MTDTSIENNEIGNEPLTRLEIASISLAVELGMDPMTAYNLICELKAFSPEYHKRIQEIAQLYLEARSALLYLLKEIEKTKQLEHPQNLETPTKISYDEKIATNTNKSVNLETAINYNIQQSEKALNEKTEEIEETTEKPPQEKTEEQIIEELHEIAQEQEKTEEKILEKLREVTKAQANTEERDIIPQDVKENIPITEHTPENVADIVPQDVKENIPITEQVHVPEQASQEPRLETKEEIEKWLSDTENHFEEMSVEKQEEIMPRYIQLKALTCKNKKETGPSCIGCLVGNTIDCPLFNRTSKKR